MGTRDSEPRIGSASKCCTREEITTDSANPSHCHPAKAIGFPLRVTRERALEKAAYALAQSMGNALPE